MSTPSVAEAIRADQQQHPDCRYSTIQSQSCRNNAQGELACRVLERVLRHCRGRATVEIHSQVKEELVDGADARGAVHPFGGHGRFFSTPWDSDEGGDPLSMMEHFLRRHTDMFEGFPGHERPSQPPEGAPQFPGSAAGPESRWKRDARYAKYDDSSSEL
mmetsp:Transcript_8748/g.27599  ORF Transcript_8748/g.27599 Transcript_8748/m.27599 type:complete len:160 (-) Transcript_8748:682-1161(-)